MMSYELFSLASELRQQAAACQRLRANVDAVWRGLDHVLDNAVAGHRPEVWQSAAADASRLRLHHQRTHLIRLRYEAEQVARRLQSRADELYADASLVEHAAEAALREEAQTLQVQAGFF